MYVTKNFNQRNTLTFSFVFCFDNFFLNLDGQEDYLKLFFQNPAFKSKFKKFNKSLFLGSFFLEKI